MRRTSTRHTHIQAHKSTRTRAYTQTAAPPSPCCCARLPAKAHAHAHTHTHTCTCNAACRAALPRRPRRLLATIASPARRQDGLPLTAPCRPVTAVPSSSRPPRQHATAVCDRVLAGCQLSGDYSSTSRCTEYNDRCLGSRHPAALGCTAAVASASRHGPQDMYLRALEQCLVSEHSRWLASRVSGRAGREGAGAGPARPGRSPHGS